MAEENKVKSKGILDTAKMQEAGLHFGHTVSKLHPKFKPFVSGIKNNVHVIDLDKSAREFERSLKFLQKLAAEGKKILFVGTKIQMQELTRRAAEEVNMPYVTERWLGGTFTNFDTIFKRVQHFKDLETRKAQGDFEKYTKKERLKLDKEIASLKTKFEGIRNMSSLPDAVLILDMRKDDTAVREARRKGVAIVGVVDTNIDPTAADYLIPANDDAISSIAHILGRVKEAISAK